MYCTLPADERVRDPRHGQPGYACLRMCCQRATRDQHRERPSEPVGQSKRAAVERLANERGPQPDHVEGAEGDDSGDAHAKEQSPEEGALVVVGIAFRSRKERPMSLDPMRYASIYEDIARVARAAFPNANVYIPTMSASAMSSSTRIARQSAPNMRRK